MKIRVWIRYGVRAGTVVVTGLLALILAVSVWLILSKVWLKREVPSVLGFSPIYVMSGSMEPTFSAGDLIIIHPQSWYQPGDVVTFKSGGELVTHRIISEGRDGFSVQGDANNVRDEEKVKPGDIVGRQILILPHVGSIAFFLRTRKGALVLAVVILAALLQTIREQRRRPRSLPEQKE